MEAEGEGGGGEGVDEVGALAGEPCHQPEHPPTQGLVGFEGELLEGGLRRLLHLVSPLVCLPFLLVALGCCRRLVLLQLLLLEGSGGGEEESWLAVDAHSQQVVPVPVDHAVFEPRIEAQLKAKLQVPRHHQDEVVEEPSAEESAGGGDQRSFSVLVVDEEGVLVHAFCLDLHLPPVLHSVHHPAALPPGVVGEREAVVEHHLSTPLHKHARLWPRQRLVRDEVLGHAGLDPRRHGQPACDLVAAVVGGEEHAEEGARDHARRRGGGGVGADEAVQLVELCDERDAEGQRVEVAQHPRELTEGVSHG
mmetsp:Transcript_37613/g.88940  ORF Transcript_37613/g.88940 Transcript_37613/m.88940 type:complete len:307 (-) Transcript_37613:250-1170(-)